MAKHNKADEKANRAAREETISASDTQILAEIMDYIEGHIGALEMVFEALEENREQVSPEIPRRPVDALDSVIGNMTERYMEWQAKRGFATELTQGEPTSDTPIH